MDHFVSRWSIIIQLIISIKYHHSEKILIHLCISSSRIGNMIICYRISPIWFVTITKVGCNRWPIGAERHTIRVWCSIVVQTIVTRLFECIHIERIGMWPKVVPFFVGRKLIYRLRSIIDWNVVIIVCMILAILKRMSGRMMSIRSGIDLDLLLLVSAILAKIIVLSTYCWTYVFTFLVLKISWWIIVAYRIGSTIRSLTNGLCTSDSMWIFPNLLKFKW